MSGARVIAAAAVLGAGILLATRARASAAPAEQGGGVDLSGDYFNADLFKPEAINVKPNDTAANNLAAFLLAIRTFESSTGEKAYRTLYGGQLWDGSLSEHPANQGWKGVPLSDRMCSLAGFGPGCVSTAAGAYQIIRPTWNALRDRMGLPDFSAASQDLAAVQLLAQCNALEDIRAGRFDAAVRKAARVWASMPGNAAGQAQASLGRWRTAFLNNGGTLA